MRLSFFQQALVRGRREPAASALLEQPRQMPAAAHVQARGDPGKGIVGLDRNSRANWTFPRSPLRRALRSARSIAAA